MAIITIITGITAIRIMVDRVFISDLAVPITEDTAVEKTTDKKSDQESYRIKDMGVS